MAKRKHKSVNWGQGRQEVRLLYSEIRDDQNRGIPLSQIYSSLKSAGKITCAKTAFYDQVKILNEDHADLVIREAITKSNKAKTTKTSTEGSTRHERPASGPAIVDTSKNLSPEKRKSTDDDTVVGENW